MELGRNSEILWSILQGRSLTVQATQQNVKLRWSLERISKPYLQLGRLTHWPLSYQGFGPDGGSPTLNSFRTNDFESFLYGSSKHIWMNKNGSCDCIRNNIWVIMESWLRVKLKSSQWVVLSLNYQLTVTCLTSRPHTNLKWSFWVDLHNWPPTYKDGALTHWATEG